MSIVYEPEQMLFHLSTERTSYLCRVFDNGYLYHQYWGRRIRTADLSHLWQVYPGLAVNYQNAPDNRYSQDLIPSEYPVFGHGDFRNPAVMVTFPDGNRLLNLQYLSLIHI